MWVSSRLVLLDEPTAIAHDWFQGMHGSERVVDAHSLGPLPERRGEPDIFTFAAAREVFPAELADRIVRESRLGSLPGHPAEWPRGGRWRYLLPYMPHYFASLDLSPLRRRHRLVARLRGQRAAARGRALRLLLPHADALRVASRDRRGSDGRDRQRSACALFGGHLRRTDLAASRRPDAFAANSTAVRDRIRRFYGRDATVIHPPVDVGELDATPEKEPGHFLWVHRLVPYKQPELVAEAFRGLPYRLTMVGVGPLEARAAEAASAQRRAARLGLARGARRALRAARRASSTSARRTSASRWSRRSPPARRWSLSTREARATSSAHGVDGVLIERAELGELQAAIRAVAQRSWDPHDAPQPRALEFSTEPLPRADARLARRGVASRHADDRSAGRVPVPAAMRIGIDARNDQAGIGRYTFSLIRELAQIDRENEYVLFLSRERFASYAAPGPNFRAVEADDPLVHGPRAAAAAAPRRARAARSHPLPAPDGAARSRRRRSSSPSTTSTTSTAATSPTAEAEPRLRRAGYRVELAKARRARRLIAVSEHTRDTARPRASRRSGADRRHLRGGGSARSGRAGRSVLERYGLDAPFFLYVGAAYPYKNLARLIDAFARPRRRPQARARGRPGALRPRSGAARRGRRPRGARRLSGPGLRRRARSPLRRRARLRLRLALARDSACPGSRR